MSGSASNYNITFTNGVLTVNAAPLTIVADTLSKIYGNNDPALTYLLTSGTLFNGDALSGNLTRVAGTNVGTYAINQGTLGHSNYNITFTPGSLAITPRDISITVTPLPAKIYGDADNLSFTVGGLGLATTDTNAAVASAVTRTAGENVGTYAVSQGTLTNGNYNVTTFSGSTLTISPALLNIIANNLSKYEETGDPALTFAVNGLKFTDTATTTLSGTLARVAGEALGSYSIGNGSLSVNNANYTYDPAINFTPGTFTIMPVPAITPPILSALVGTTVMLQTTGNNNALAAEGGIRTAFGPRKLAARQRSTSVAAADATTGDAPASTTEELPATAAGTPLAGAPAAVPTLICR
jgi:hypothetical protein